MKKLLCLSLLTVGLFAFILNGCKSEGQIVKDLRGQVKNQDLSLRSMQSTLQELQAQNAQLKEENIILRNKVASMERQLNLTKEFGLTMDKIISLPGVSGDNSDVYLGKNFIRFSSDFLFDSGSAILKKKAKKMLDKFAEEVKAKNLYLRIDGHTDSDPIVKSKRKYTSGSNFELAADRALQVLLYLQKQGVKPGNMLLVSWSQYNPISKKSKAKNRRVEIYWSTLPHSIQSAEAENVQEKDMPIPEKGEVLPPEKGAVEGPEK